MTRIYIFPKIVKNISDDEDWVITKEKHSSITADAIKRLLLFIWVSKYPSPITEPKRQWIKDSK